MTATVARRRAGVEVPATIANLGAGYDCLALAVDLSLTVSIQAVARRQDGRLLDLRIEGEGTGELPRDRSNRVVRALESGLGALGLPGLDGLDGPAWRIEIQNAIPIERGLGASAAATIAGLSLAEALAHRPLGPDVSLRLATELEGHADNVAAALLGGLVACVVLDERIETVRLEPPPGLELVAFIPDRRLVTADMRRVLPETIPRADAVANLGRVAAAVAGLATGRTDVIGFLTDDRLHEPYRAEVYPELPILAEAGRGAGALGACLAGAGSTVAAFVDAARDSGARGRVATAMAEAAARAGLPGRIAVLTPRSAPAAWWTDEP